MSSPRHPRSPLEVSGRPACMCAGGAECSSFAPGHALHLVQARLVAATPAEWVDALVESTDADTGETVLRTVAEDRRIRVWSAAAPGVAAGDPVALHGRYRVLIAGSRRLNVALLDPQA